MAANCRLAEKKRIEHKASVIQEREEEAARQQQADLDRTQREERGAIERERDARQAQLKQALEQKERQALALEAEKQEMYEKAALMSEKLQATTEKETGLLQQLDAAGDICPYMVIITNSSLMQQATPSRPVLWWRRSFLSSSSRWEGFRWRPRRLRRRPDRPGNVHASRRRPSLICPYMVITALILDSTPFLVA